jgi:membrane-bound serine protease (ClpP class)
MHSAMTRWASILMAGSMWVAWGNLRATEVGLIKINGAIGPATAGYVSRAIDVAAKRHDACLIIQLDTPGGLLDSTKDIVQKFYASPVPTVVYVSPPGASAGSAGVFITLAADVAAMAPNTSIGAAHPVSIGMGGGLEKTDDVMKKKMENYASTFIESIADRRHRNVEWARSAVVDSKATTGEKALEVGVIDLIAKDLPDLLQRLDGRTAGDKRLNTAKAEVFEIRMTALERSFQMLWRPEVMFILMLVVIYGLIGELSNPGAILPGVVGAIALILVLYMSAILPVNTAGLALIGLAVALFIVDVFAPTHGILTAGGIVSFFLGALMLFDRSDASFRLSLAYIIPATVLTAAFFVFIVGAGLRAQFRPVQSGSETMMGKTVGALSRIDAGGGWVFIEGESWKAVSETPVEAGQLVEVIGVEGLRLKVKPKNQ